MILSLLHYIFSTEEGEGGDVAYHLERVGVTVHHHLLPPPLPPTFYEKAPGKSISHSSRSSSSRLRVEPSFSLCLSLSPSSREKPTSPAGPLVDTEPPGQVLERAEKKEGEAFSGNPST